MSFIVTNEDRRNWMVLFLLSFSHVLLQNSTRALTLLDEMTKTYFYI